MKVLIGGIDEAGRGPLAGPVSLALMVAPKGYRFVHPTLGKIRDSKQLTPRQREIWYEYLTSEPDLTWVHSYVTVRTIDRINILKAACLGAYRLVVRVREKPHLTYLDGSLALPSRIPHRVVPHGDERIPIIAAASIIAKVRRDRYMVRMAKKFPLYEFEKHKGYGTRNHIKVLQIHGPSALHRSSFLSFLEKPETPLTI